MRIRLGDHVLFRGLNSTLRYPGIVIAYELGGGVVILSDYAIAHNRSEYEHRPMRDVELDGDRIENFGYRGDEA
jgi:hypothetical protein